MYGMRPAKLGKRKPCRSCNEMRWLNEDFYKNPSSSDGYRATCKSCERIRRKIPPAVNGTPGLHDCPYGLAECERCNKLIPCTEGGGLEPHHRMVDLNASGAYPTIRTVECTVE